jgi:NADPH:quinone reductase-like Zn-dependent oxidoreductase
VAVSEDAPLARVPTGLDDVVAAALPTAGGAGLALVDQLEPLADKTVLIVGAAAASAPSLRSSWRTPGGT